MELINEQEDAELMIRAYRKLGKQRLDEIGYTKSSIAKAIKQYDESYCFSLPVVSTIRTEFDPILNISISKGIIRDKLQVIYNKFDIGISVKLNTIEKYYNATPTNNTTTQIYSKTIPSRGGTKLDVAYNRTKTIEKIPPLNKLR